jgi:NADH dehydrogenase FAD-containing subunit
MISSMERLQRKRDGVEKISFKLIVTEWLSRLYIEAEYGKKTYIKEQNESIHRAVFRKDRDELTRLISKGIDPDSGDSAGLTPGNRIITGSGRNLNTDMIINATGVKPSSIFRDSGIVTDEEGALSVNTYLQSPQYPEVFGTGDCIHFMEKPLKKAGVYAVKQNRIIFHNLQAYLSGSPLIPFKPQNNYMTILNTGFERGILFRKPFLLRGRLPFVIKDLIDRRFIKQYQE